MVIRRVETVILSFVFSGFMLPALIQIALSVRFAGAPAVFLVVLLALCFALGVAGAVIHLLDSRKKALLFIAGIVGVAAAVLMGYLSMALTVSFVLALIGGAGLILVSIVSKGRRL